MARFDVKVETVVGSYPTVKIIDNENQERFVDHDLSMNVEDAEDLRDKLIQAVKIGLASDE